LCVLMFVLVVCCTLLAAYLVSREKQGEREFDEVETF
jgi:hypothetical protein